MPDLYRPKSLRCPKCGQDYSFQVICFGQMTAYLDGTGDVEEADNTHPELSPDNSCTCPDCLYVASLKQFELEE